MLTVRNLFALGLVAAAIVGCGGDDVTSTMMKGTVDMDRIVDDPPPIGIEGEQGSFTIPFAIALPDVPREEFEMEMEAAVSVQIQHPHTGGTVDLTEGVLVEDTPDAPGEWTWSTNEERTEVILDFFNQTVDGAALEAGTTYMVLMSIAANQYMDEMPAQTFEVTVE